MPRWPVMLACTANFLDHACYPFFRRIFGATVTVRAATGGADKIEIASIELKRRHHAKLVRLSCLF